jgi:hypothetical protein
MSMYGRRVNGTPSQQRPSVLDAAVFVDELLLLAALAVDGASIAVAGASRIVLAIVLPAAGGVVWGRWLAPRAPQASSWPSRAGPQGWSVFGCVRTARR